jgi:hypothetical protein
MRTAPRRRGSPLVALLALPLAGPAQAEPFALADGDPATLVVLLVGLAMILVAFGVVVFAIRQWRREARERRRLYRRRGHAGDGRSASSTGR